MDSTKLAEAGLDAAPPATTPTNTDFPKGPPPPRSGTGSGSASRVQATAASLYYLYDMAQLTDDSTGGTAVITIGSPNVAAADHHSLAEIAVQSEDGKQVVEVGWHVDPDLYDGNTDPHLFTYHWINGEKSCYNKCGFVSSTGAPIKPGAVLATDGNDAKEFGLWHSKGNWWVWYDKAYIGYFPDSLWGGGFTSAGYVQWFGEVAASVARPCNNRTQMGNGISASSSSAAAFTGIRLYEAPVKPITVYAGTGNVFPTQRVNNTSFRFGGPGVC
jgi:hypothetical protein